LRSPDPHERALAEVKIQPDPSAWDESTRRHVEECASCRRTAAASSILRDRLAALESFRAKAPDALAEWVRDLARGELAPGASDSPTASREPAAVPPVSDRSSRWRWWVPAALAAGILLGFGLAGGLHLHRGQPGGVPPATVVDYLQDVTHDDYLFSQISHPLEQEITDPAQASRWLSRGLPFQLELASAPQGWTLEGVRIWHTLSRLSALASYRGPRGERILLFAVPREGISQGKIRPVGPAQEALYPGQGWGNQGVVWFEGDLAWAATSSIERSRLEEWVRQYRSAASRAR